MKATTLTTALAAISMVTLVIADSKTFPLAGGDISVSSAWGSVGFPDSDDEVLIDQSGRYTAFANMSIGRLELQTSGVNMDLASDRKITLSQVNSTSDTALMFGGQGVENFISGGFWYAPNAGRVHFLKHGNHIPSASSSLTVSGSVFTNHHAAVMITRLHNSTVTLTDGTRLYVNVDLVGVERANDGETVVFTNNSVIINNGAKVEVGGHLYPDSRGRDNLFLAEGEGSLIKVSGTVYFGGGTNCVFRISNNAHAELKSVISGRTGDDNRFVVSDGATAALSSLTIDLQAGASGNGAEFLASGEVKCTGAVKVGEASSAMDSYVVVSNCTIATGSWNVGNQDGASTGTKVIFKGTSPSVLCADTSSSKTFQVYGGSEIIWEVPAEGFSTIPIQLTKYSWNDEDIVLTVKGKEFRRRGGGRVELLNAVNAAWLNLNSGHLNTIIEKMNAKRAQTGCSFSVDGTKLVCDVDPLPGLVISIK